MCAAMRTDCAHIGSRTALVDRGRTSQQFLRMDAVCGHKIHLFLYPTHFSLLPSRICTQLESCHKHGTAHGYNNNIAQRRVEFAIRSAAEAHLMAARLWVKRMSAQPFLWTTSWQSPRLAISLLRGACHCGKLPRLRRRLDGDRSISPSTWTSPASLCMRAGTFSERRRATTWRESGGEVVHCRTSAISRSHRDRMPPPRPRRANNGAPR